MIRGKRPPGLDAVVFGLAILLAALAAGLLLSRPRRGPALGLRPPTPPVLITYQPQSLAAPLARLPIKRSGTKSAAATSPAFKESRIEKPGTVRLSVPPPDK